MDFIIFLLSPFYKSNKIPEDVHYSDFIMGKGVLGTPLYVIPKNPLIHDEITVMDGLFLRHQNVPMDKVEVSFT